MQILNKKQVKEILNLMKKQWNCDSTFDYVFLQKPDGKLFIINKEVFALDQSRLRVNSMGLYIAEIKGTDIRLSIEGSQLIGPKATKNVIELSKEQARSWLKGEDIQVTGDYSGFVILKHNNDFLGSGKYKQGTVLNFVPKTRRIS